MRYWKSAGWAKRKIPIDTEEKPRYNLHTYVLPVEEEEYALIAIREGWSTGCKAAREGNARKVALEGADDPGRPVQSARVRPIQRTEAQLPKTAVCANEGGTTQALLRPLGRSACFYLLNNRERSVLRAQSCLILVKRFGGKKMNFGAEMMPGITLLVVGAFLGFFADGVCRNKKNVQPMRMLGTFLAIAGAIMVFIA